MLTLSILFADSLQDSISAPEDEGNPSTATLKLCGKLFG